MTSPKKKETVYFDDGHIRISSCPNDPVNRLHMRMQHVADHDQLPECWSLSAALTLLSGLSVAMASRVAHGPELPVGMHAVFRGPDGQEIEPEDLGRRARGFDPRLHHNGHNGRGPP